MEIYSETQDQNRKSKGGGKKKTSGLVQNLRNIARQKIEERKTQASIFPQKSSNLNPGENPKEDTFSSTKMGTFVKIAPHGKTDAKETEADFYFSSTPSEKIKKEFSKKIEMAKNLPIQTKKIILVGAGAFLLLIFIGSFNSYRLSFKKLDRVTEISPEQQEFLDEILDEAYSKERSRLLKPLPYPVSPVDLDIWAGSAILVDAANGCVIFEKNADTLIPPASIAKIFVMYVVLKDVHDGKISLDDIVPLPEKSWAVNMPSDASLMFLGQGQIVTLRELMLGLAVASGNDAAIAIARYISGGTEEFVKRMNEECKNLGLTKTHFVEPSGYSEENITTARELATFARIYITEYPESIKLFHSAKSIRYPLEKNLPSWQKEFGDSKAIYQKNTNPLLGEMAGVDGIKTGFIYESGYNLALTAQRNGNRFISITLMGPGKGSKQGNQGRVHDGHEMMDFAFNSFADYNPEKLVKTSYTVAVPGGKEKFTRLVPAWSNSITVPHIFGGETPLDDAAKVQAEVTIPKSIYGETMAGMQYGQIQYKLGDVVLETVPLVSDRTVEKGNLWKRFWALFI